MIYIIYTIAALIIISKFLDCYTTSKNIGEQNPEQNPIANKLMQKFGTQTTIWSIFVFTILIVTLSTYYILDRTIIEQVVFCIIGLFLTIIQSAVAYSNQFPLKRNIIVHKLRSIIGR